MVAYFFSDQEQVLHSVELSRSNGMSFPATEDLQFSQLLHCSTLSVRKSHTQMSSK